MSRDLADNRAAQRVSTGAGIAIAGIWIAAASLTGLLVLVALVWAPEQVVGALADQKDDGGGWFLLIVLLALPMFAAFGATMKILGRDD